jgi:hypothetical protein
MKTFVSFMEDGMGGGAPATSTAGVSGAGDNPDKTVPVPKKTQSKLLARASTQSLKPMRRITSAIKFQ